MIIYNFHVECEEGHFGVKCIEQCHCEPGASCDKVTGHCTGDSCAPGWKDHPICQTGENIFICLDLLERNEQECDIFYTLKK